MQLLKATHGDSNADWLPSFYYSTTVQKSTVSEASFNIFLLLSNKHVNYLMEQVLHYTLGAH